MGATIDNREDPLYASKLLVTISSWIRDATQDLSALGQEPLDLQWVVADDTSDEEPRFDDFRFPEGTRDGDEACTRD